MEKINKIDMKTRKMLTVYKMHHPKVDIDMLYVRRKEGGSGWYELKRHIKQK